MNDATPTCGWNESAPPVKVNTGGPAFPMPTVHSPDWGTMEKGMTLRDWFAGQALAGMYSNDADGYKFDKVAEAAYETADAMLKARDE